MKVLGDRVWAIFFCRAILGLIFFMAGVYKCFVMTPFGHARHYFVGPYATRSFRHGPSGPRAPLFQW